MTARAIREHQGYMSAKKAAEFLDVDVGTLAQWRFHKRYPIPCIRLGKGKRGGRCFYRKIDLIRAMESHLTGRGSE